MGASLVHRIRIEAHTIALAVRDPRTPPLARVIGIIVAAYALSPIDLIPDFIPILGLADDALIIPAGVWLFEKMVPAALLAEHRAAAESASDRPTSRWGILIILGLWALIAWLAWTMAVFAYD